MRITNEADYAVRIAYVLAKDGGTLPAREIAERSGVTQRFALKILRKLTTEGIISSFKGSAGGYALRVPPGEVSLGRIIEAIDGPLEISHCLCEEYPCTRVEDKTVCAFRQVFQGVSREMRDKLYSFNMDQFI